MKRNGPHIPLHDILLTYHVDIPVIVFRSTYVLVALVMYSSALYYIRKKDYPWSIWVGKR